MIPKRDQILPFLLVQLASVGAIRLNAGLEPGCTSIALKFSASHDRNIPDRIQCMKEMQSEMTDILEKADTEIENVKLAMSKVSIFRSEDTLQVISPPGRVQSLHQNHLKAWIARGYLQHEGHVTLNLLPLKLPQAIAVISSQKSPHHDYPDISVTVSTLGTHPKELARQAVLGILRGFELSLSGSNALEYLTNTSSIITTTNGHDTFTEEAVKATAKFAGLFQCPKPEVNDITTPKSLSGTAPKAPPTSSKKPISLELLIVLGIAGIVILVAVAGLLILHFDRSFKARLAKKEHTKMKGDGDDDIEMGERTPLPVDRKI